MNGRRLPALRPMTRAKILRPHRGMRRSTRPARAGFIPLCVFARPPSEVRGEFAPPTFLRPVRGRRRTPRADSFDAPVEARFRPPSGERIAPSPDTRLPALPPCASSAPRPIRLPASAASGSDWPSGTSRVACHKPANPTSCRHAVACAAPWTPANAPHDCARPWGAVTATPATKPQGGNFSNGPPTPASCGRAPFPNWPACASPRRAAPETARFC